MFVWRRIEKYFINVEKMMSDNEEKDFFLGFYIFLHQKNTFSVSL